MSFVLFFSHHPQLEWYALLAREIAARLGLETRLWVVGESDRRCGEQSGAFDRVDDLLEGLEPAAAESRFALNRERLAALERRRGTTFYHEAVACDRSISHRGWTGAQVAEYAACIVRRMGELLDAAGAGPRMVFGENNTLAYRLAHAVIDSTTPYWHFSTTRHWPGRFFLDRNQDMMWPRCVQFYREATTRGLPADLEDEARARLEDLRRKSEQPLFMKRVRRGLGSADSLDTKLQPGRLWRVLRNWSHELWHRPSQRDPKAQTAWQLNPLYKTSQTVRQIINRQYFDRRSGDALPADPRLASYFLHVQPEHTVEGLAFEYRDQVAVIENIASYLPAEYVLVVKEHKGMVGRRAPSYYQRILDLPNVVLIADSLSPYDVIRRSEMVLTLTGTSALEAMYVGVPAVVMGRVFSAAFAGIHVARSFGELREVIQSIAAGERLGASDDEAARALAAMFAASYPGRILGLDPDQESHSPENIRCLVDAIQRELSELEAAGAP